MHWREGFAHNITNRKNGWSPKWLATVTSKGQTTIPKDVRAAANLKPGDRIRFTVLEDGTIIVRVKSGSIRESARRSASLRSSLIDHIRSVNALS